MTEAAIPVPAPSPTKKKRRIFLWFFLAVQVLFLVWIIAGANSGGTATDCGSLSAADCQAAQDIGTGIGVVLLIVLWFFTDAFLGVVYGVYRLAKRA